MKPAEPGPRRRPARADRRGRHSSPVQVAIRVGDLSILLVRLAKLEVAIRTRNLQEIQFAFGEVQSHADRMAGRRTR